MGALTLLGFLQEHGKAKTGDNCATKDLQWDEKVSQKGEFTGYADSVSKHIAYLSDGSGCDRDRHSGNI